MSYTERIPDALFQEDGHFLGRPADFNDRIVNRRIRLVENVPNFLHKDCTLLDIGCGNGASMFILADRLKKCDGIEITNDHKADFDNYKAKNGITNCSYGIVDVTESKPKEQYDRIISFEVVEHLSTEDGLKYYHDALKEDGMMAISIPNKWWIFETHGAKLPLLPWNRVPFFSWLPRPIHEKFANARIYTKNRITNLLDKHGFETVQCHYITAPMDVLPEGALKNLATKYIFNTDTTNIPFKAVSIFVVAKKKKTK